MNIYACYEVNCNSLAIDTGAITNLSLFSNWDMVKRWFDIAIAQGIHDGFVIDENRPDKLDAIATTPAEVNVTLFKGRQYNWNESYDITIEIKTLDSVKETEMLERDLRRTT